MEPKFTYLYTEGTKGYLHIAAIGQGIQGSASLVRSNEDGQVYVRKAGLYDPPFGCDDDDPAGLWCPEVSNYRPHQNINQLIDYQHYEHDFKIHANLITRYCNGGSLSQLFDKFDKLELTFPEALVWRFLRDAMSGLSFLHQQRPAIGHNDLCPGNILVDWPTESALGPKMLLGDFGMSSAHDIGGDHDKADVWEEYTAGVAFSRDYFNVATIALMLMHGDDKDLECNKPENYALVEAVYSEELIQCVGGIFDLAEFVEDNIYADSTALRDLIERGARSCPADGVNWELVRPSEPKSTPLLFDSYEALMSHVPWPPGPWHPAAVDPETFEIIGTLSNPECAHDVYFTDENGRPVRIPFTS